MNNRHQDYISKVRTSNLKVWDGIQELLTAQVEYNALDYGNTLPAGEGANAGITRAQIGAVVFDTANAFKSVLASGHATNMGNIL